ncbi:predicted protein [Histoplasma capsulatum var. duboisii H88]|uniref:Predicted protein n=1 Tax=Ajellomyces capsulatus (strain H88) TaxID=544711 RepID=F0UUG2_AJEC8|nr:predicted protein [Histoplasma capsulatum var. duboisii H88]
MKEGERPIAGMSKNEWIEGQKQGWIRTKTKGRDCNGDKLEGISEEKRVGGRVVVIAECGQTVRRVQSENVRTQPPADLTERYSGDEKRKIGKLKSEPQHSIARGEMKDCFVSSSQFLGRTHCK